MKRRTFFLCLFLIVAFSLSLQTSYVPQNGMPSNKDGQTAAQEEKKRPSKLERLIKAKEEYLQRKTESQLDASSSNVDILGVWPYGSSRAVALDVPRNFALIGNGLVIQVLDLSTPSSPADIGEVELSLRPSAISISGDYAYVAASDSSSLLYVLVISTLSNPAVLGSVAFEGDCWSMEASGNYVYLSASWNGLKIFDVSTPASPSARCRP